MKKLFECKYGSHLYGTDTPKSDTDFKGIYMPTYEEFLTKKKSELAQVVSMKQKPKGQRNTKDDVDREHKELRTFILDCIAGQTYAMDMLFCNDKNTIVTSPEWEFIQKNRLSLITKNIVPFVKYAQNNAARYGVRSEKLIEAQAFRQKFMLFYINVGKYKTGSTRLRDFLESHHGSLKKYSYISMVTLEGLTGPQEFLHMFDKNYELHIPVKDFKVFLEKKIEQAGNRTKQAAQDGGKDHKAISHAYRALFQIKELLTEKIITFPLKEVEYVRKLKAGEVPMEVIETELPALTEEVLNLQNPFPDDVDREFWMNWVTDAYYSFHQVGPRWT